MFSRQSVARILPLTFLQASFVPKPRKRIPALPAGEPPAFILLSTDGYVNSFSDSAGFFKVGSDLLDMLRADGFDPVNAGLKGWLEEATRSGSGDDCTVALLCRMDALREVEVKTQTEAAQTNETPAAPTLEPVEQPAAEPDGQAA